MAVDIGPKIGIDGEKEFRREIADINQSLKTMASESKAVASSFDETTTAEEKYAKQADVINRQIEAQKDKIALLEKGLQESAKMYGEADSRTMKWKQAVYEATSTLNNMESGLDNLNKGVEENVDSMEDAGKAATGWADTMKGKLLADAVKSGLSKLAGWIKDAASALWDASKAGAAYADSILTLSQTSSLTTDTVQEFQYMADLIDVSVDTITGSLTKLTSNMNKARDGSGTAAEAFEDLGVSIKNENGQIRKNEDVFYDVIEALGKIDNETERDAKAMTLFGKSAKDLNPLINAGKDSLKTLAKEAHDTGYVLSGDALTALGKQQDAMDRFAKKTEAVGNAFAVNMAPGIEKVYNTMSDVFDNPRVERGINAISESIGNVISGAADLAAQVLPELFSVFNFGDERLRLYNETQLELVNTAEELKSSHENLMAGFRGKAEVIVEETERLQNLWAELMTLADETGKVNDADKERVDYILKELNDALDTEYERNGDIIEQYQDMQKEIRNLIKQREAEALLEAGKDAYVNANTNRTEALQKAAELYEQLLVAQENYNAAQKVSDEWWAENEDEFVNAILFKRKRLEAEAQDVDGAAARALQTLQMLRKDYENASDSAASYYETVDRFERAQSAMLQGNYVEVVRIMADELGVTMDYYRQKQELNEQDKKDLEEKIKAAELAVEEYKRNLEAGLTGFSEAGLKEMEDYIKDAKKILNGESVANSYSDGLVNGMSSKDNTDKVYKAAHNLAKKILNATEDTLLINSPSKVGVWIGQMWDQGMIKGIEDKETELAKAATSLADTIIDASTPAMGTGYGYGNALTAAPLGAYGATGPSSYTTNMGGITVMVEGAGAMNEDVLAQRIAVQLTHELQRVQRGGRA